MTRIDGRHRAAIALVLAAAQRCDGELPFEQLPAVTAVFPDRRELVTALQRLWAQVLDERIDRLAEGATSNAITVTGAAWQQARAEHPVLWRLVDTYRDETATREGRRPARCA